MNEQLLDAAGNGDLALVQQLLQNGANAEATDTHGDTPLHRACEGGHLRVVRYLMLASHGANNANRLLTTENEEGQTPFEKASRGLGGVRKFLLNCYAETVFAREGRRSVHAVLREATFTHHRLPRRSETLLKICLPIGKVGPGAALSLLQSLVALSPASLHEIDANGDSPLLVACSESQTPSVWIWFFVETDADLVHIANRAGALPIHAACGAGASFNVIRLLTANGGAGTLQQQDSKGALPIHVACVAGAAFNVIQLLAVKGNVGTLQQQDANGALPIHLACGAGASFDVIQLLTVNGGAGTLQQQDSKGALPIHVACAAGASFYVIQLLIDNGGTGTLHVQDDNGALPIHLACAAGAAFDVIQLLAGTAVRVHCSSKIPKVLCQFTLPVVPALHSMSSSFSP